MAVKIRRKEIECPHCGKSQLEPEGVVSTFCRHCSEHIDLTEVGVDIPSLPRPPEKSLPQIPIHCHKCNKDHRISRSAKTTICPHCSTSIAITDLDIKAPASRAVDIRGRLRVRPKASLNNSWIACTDALIEGKLTGNLFCEGRLEWKGSGRVAFGCANTSTRIERNVVLQLLTPLRTGHLELHGDIEGDIECSGQVHLHKHASLRGNITARAVIVEKGATWEGFARIWSPPVEVAGE